MCWVTDVYNIASESDYRFESRSKRKALAIEDCKNADIRKTKQKNTFLLPVLSFCQFHGGRMEVYVDGLSFHMKTASSEAIIASSEAMFEAIL